SLGVHGADVTDQADVHQLAVDQYTATLGGEQAAVLTRHADREGAVGVDQIHQLAADLPDQHHPDDLHRLRCRDSQPAAELRGDAQPVQHGRDLRATTVHDDRVHP